jgi:tetratricopeptide (TPR) repeat protein
MLQAFNSRSLTSSIVLAFVLLVISIDACATQGFPEYFLTCAAASVENESASTLLLRTSDGSLDWAKIQDLTVLTKNLDGKIISSQRAKFAGDFENFVEAYKIRYLSDKLEVVGFIFVPLHENLSQKLPLIIYNRGGNREFSKITDDKFTYMSLFALNGYVVLASQYRGNDGGQGKEEYGGKDINDVLDLIKMAESLPFIDSNKIVMYGTSRGGLMTYLATSKSSKIKAACVNSGIADLIQTYEEREQAMKDTLIDLIGGTPGTKRNEYINRSAVYWPERINAPLLILHGDNDWRVNVSQAKELAKKLDELNKPNKLIIYPHGTHGLGEYHEDRDRRILEWFEKYIGLNAQSYWRIGLELANTGSFNKSLDYANKSIELNPNLSQPWNLKGAALSVLGKYNESIECLNKATELNPSFGKAWLNKGKTFNELGRYDEANKCFDKVIGLAQQNEVTWNEKGKALYGLGNYEDAHNAFTQAGELNESFAEAFCNDGLALKALGRDSRAKWSFDKAKKLGLLECAPLSGP